jgi:hypothetical protein
VDDRERQILHSALLEVLEDLPPHLRRQYEFKIREDEGSFYVALKDGRHRGDGTPLAVNSDTYRMATIAEGLQECLQEILWVVWPECQTHRLGLHVRVQDDQAMWSCEGVASHFVASVGTLQK